jgi:hypothetical protein
MADRALTGDIKGQISRQRCQHAMGKASPMRDSNKSVHTLEVTTSNVGAATSANLSLNVRIHNKAVATVASDMYTDFPPTTPRTE